MNWQDNAACRDQPHDYWYAEKHKEGAQQLLRQGKAICAECPVRAECLEHAVINNERHGVWGGLSPRQRQPLRRGRVIVRHCPTCDAGFTVTLGLPRNGAAEQKIYCNARCMRIGSDDRERAQRVSRAESPRDCQRCGLSTVNPASEWAPYCWPCGKAVQRERFEAMNAEVVA